MKIETRLVLALILLFSNSALAADKPVFQCTSICEDSKCITSSLDLIKKDSLFDLKITIRSPQEPAPRTVLHTSLDNCAIKDHLFFCDKRTSEGTVAVSVWLEQTTRSSLMSPDSFFVRNEVYYDLWVVETLAQGPFVDWETVKRLTGTHKLLQGFLIDCQAKIPF